MDAVSSMTFALLYVIHTHCFVESLLLFWLGRQATINGISKAFGKYACSQKEVTSKDNEGRHTKRLIKFYWKRSFGRVTRACNFGFIHYIKVHRKKALKPNESVVLPIGISAKMFHITFFQSWSQVVDCREKKIN